MDTISVVKEQIDELNDEKNKNERLLSNFVLLNDVVSILYQVSDFASALDMILDTCVEYFKISRVGVLIKDESGDHFKIVKQRNIDNNFVEQFQFNLNQKINGLPISNSDYTHIENIDAKIDTDGAQTGVDSNINSIYLFPVKFHEQTLGFLLIIKNKTESNLNNDDIKLSKMLSTQIAPVLYSFDSVRKSENSFESIINKIVKDRMYEAQLVLSPVSFAIFRIVLLEEYDDTLTLNDAVKSYQILFRDALDDKGDLIWLTLDTALFVYPKADIFKAESICADLKEKIDNLTAGQDQQPVFALKYVCLGYPQSGKNAWEIINNLWLKLFEELNENKAHDFHV